MSEQTCIFIVGMHRSGTSALTGALQILGCGLGSKLIGPYEDNPKGFFEHEKIWRMNQEFLESRGSSWDDPFLHDPYAFADGETESFKKQITEFLQTEFKDEPLFAIKDPRICMLFPIWLDVCRTLNIKTPVVLPLRNPFEVAQSLNKRNDFPIERGLLMWMNHTLAAELVTRGLPRVFVSYESLLQEPVAVLKDIGNGLSLNFPRVWDEATGEVEQFMDRGLRHHTHAEASAGNALVKLILDYFTLLCDVAKGGRQPEEVIGEIDSFRQRYLELFTMFMHQDMTGLFQDRYRVWHADQLLAESGERVRQLERERDELRQNINDLRTEKEKVELLVREMRGTKVWRLAEFLKGKGVPAKKE